MVHEGYSNSGQMYCMRDFLNFLGSYATLDRRLVFHLVVFGFVWGFFGWRRGLLRNYLVGHQ